VTVIDSSTAAAVDRLFGGAFTPPVPDSEPEPEPEPVREQAADPQAGWPKIRDEAYHGLLGEVVWHCDPDTEADPIGVLLSLAVMCGSALGREPHLPIGTMREPARVYLALIGYTADGRKETAVKRAQAFMARVDPVWENRCITSGLNSGEALLKVIADPHQVWDGRRQRWTEVPGVEDKRLLLYEEEFATRFLKASQRRENTMVAQLDKAFNTDNLRNMAITNPISVTGAHISMIGTATPEDTVAQLSSSDIYGGFANRILWLLVRQSKLLPQGGDVDWEGEELLAGRVRDALAEARTFGAVRYSDDAVKLWDREYRERSVRVKGLDRQQAAMSARWSAISQRLSLTFAVLDGHHRIGVDHVRAALAVWDYGAESVAWMVNGPGRQGTTGNADADKLLALVVRTGGVTATDVKKLWKWDGTRIPVARALLEMRKLIIVRQEPNPGGGVARKVMRPLD
jgi:hypothetical protein